MHVFTLVVDIPLYPDCSPYDSTVWLEDPVNCYAYYICDSNQKLYHLACLPLFWSQLLMTCSRFGLPECADGGDIEYNTTLPDTGEHSRQRDSILLSQTYLSSQTRPGERRSRGSRFGVGMNRSSRGGGTKYKALSAVQRNG